MNGDGQRQAILDALNSSRDGLDTNQLAESVGLHPNTIRWHLGPPHRRRARAGHAGTAVRTREAERRVPPHRRRRRPPELLDREGFAAERNGDRVEMRRCPFYALAEGSPQVICTLHRGLIDGALAEAGSEETVERLDPFVEPGLCVAHLART